MRYESCQPIQYLALNGATKEKEKLQIYLAEKSRFGCSLPRCETNAGHTVVIGENTYKLHLIPSGIFYADKLAVIANGVVVNPFALLEEIQYLNDKGVTTDNLRISDRATYHFANSSEAGCFERRKTWQGKDWNNNQRHWSCLCGQNGTKRDCDLQIFSILRYLKRYFARNIEGKNELIETFYGAEGFDVDQTVAEVMEALNKLKPFVVDTVCIASRSKASGQEDLVGRRPRDAFWTLISERTRM